MLMLRKNPLNQSEGSCAHSLTIGDAPESDTLIKLRALTERLVPPYESLSSDEYVAKVIDIDRGNAITFGLLKNEKIAVAKTFCSKDSIFPIHSHDEREFVIVYVGSVQLNLDNELKILNVGGFVEISPGVQHDALFLEDTWMIAITVPSSIAWPETITGD